MDAWHSYQENENTRSLITLSVLDVNGLLILAIARDVCFKMLGID